MIIFLDTGPLGILTNPNRPTATLDGLQWAADHLRAGNRLMVPSIADYEVRRELTRLNRPNSLLALDTWNSLPSDRYVPLTDAALRRAASLWARARNVGTATADGKELDCDVLIAAQALEYQAQHQIADSDIVIATVNVGHLAQFCAAVLWTNITSS
jgi:predicted nucleic acid-binding protein